MRHWLLVLPMILVPLLAGCLDTSLNLAMLDAVGDGVSDARVGDGTGPFDVLDVSEPDAPDLPDLPNEGVGDLEPDVLGDVIYDSKDLHEVDLDVPEVLPDVPDVVPQVLGLFVASTVFSGESTSATWTLRAVGPVGAPTGQGMIGNTWTMHGSAIGGLK